MVPACRRAGFPETWPTDGREGGVPDPATAGPSWIQIGTEGGFLPAAGGDIRTSRLAWNMDPTTFNFGNVSDHSLPAGSGERADVIVDFSAYAGKTLILYNDAPAAFPALDPRYDYYTGAPDLTDTGGHCGVRRRASVPTPGPSCRSRWRNRSGPGLRSDAAADAFKSTATTQGVFARVPGPDHRRTDRLQFRLQHDVPDVLAQLGYRRGSRITR